MSEQESNKERERTIADLYSEQRDDYGKFVFNSFSWHFIEKPLLDKKLPNLANSQSKILDAGCGAGRNLLYLLNKGFFASNLIGADINPHMLATSSEKAPGVQLLQADLEKLPLTTNSLDLILCTHVLHYFNERKFSATMSSFSRVLKPKGSLFWLIVHPIRTTRNDLDSYLKRRWLIDETPWGTESPLHYKPTSDLLNLTIEAGFNLKSVIEPDVLLEGRCHDPENYKKYASFPSRLAVIATKKN